MRIYEDEIIEYKKKVLHFASSTPFQDSADTLCVHYRCDHKAWVCITEQDTQRRHFRKLISLLNTHWENVFKEVNIPSIIKLGRWFLVMCYATLVSISVTRVWAWESEEN